jgi:diguanylate cyclase (GGDEF)-like protein/PAS domain S-box-containing protein
MSVSSDNLDLVPQAYDPDTSEVSPAQDAAEPAPSFARALILNVVGLVVMLGLVLLAALTWQGVSSTEAAARQEVSQSLSQVSGRLQTLILATEMTAESAERAARAAGVSGATLRSILESSLAAFEQRPELSYLGLALPEGEYGNVERTADGNIFLWLFPGPAAASQNARNFILMDKGFVLHGTYPANGYDPRVRPFYQAALKAGSEGTWVPAYQWVEHLPSSAPLWGFSYVKALRSDSGEVMGVLDTDFDMPALNRFLAMLSTQYRSQIYVVEMGAPARLIGASTVGRAPASLPAELVPIIGFSGEEFVDRMTLEGEPRWVAAHRLNLKGGVTWMVIASRAAPVIEAPLRSQLLQVVGMGSAIALGLVLVSLGMARRFGRPLVELEQRVAAMGRQEPDRFVAPAISASKGFRETQLLGRALDRMAASVRQQVLAKEQQVASIRLKGAIFDFTSAAIFSLDAERRVVEWNAAAERLFGISRGVALGRPVDELLFSPQGAIDWAALLDTTEGGIFQFAGSQGAFDAECRLMTFRQEGNEIHTVVLNDITERQRMEQRLRQERDYADAVLNSLPGIFYHYGQNMRLMRWNRNLERTSGYTPDELVGSDPMLFIVEEEKELVTSRILEVFEKGESSVEANYLRRDGQRIPYYFTGVRFEHEGSEGFVGVGTDITERKHAEERIRHLALYDELTGLPNRNLIQDRIAEAMALAHHSERLFSLLYLDLDRFKVVNDGYGHLYGNAVLKAAGQQLLQIVGEEGTVARLGGDEFLILLPDLGQPQDAEGVARQIIDSFSAPIVVEDREIHLSVSIGLCVFPHDGETTDGLIDNADMAMYRAKELGRNTYQFFTRGMGQEIQRRVDLEIKLRNAVATGQLQLVYQPKVSLKSRKISGCEALLRWRHPELGIISPAHFVPIAEDSGLIVPIGDWVLRTACSQARAWMDSGLPPVCVAVNISVRQFLRQDVVTWVAQTLQDTGLPPEYLELELTESLIAHDIENVTDTINHLKDLGIKLSIDDFGTGYSSLNYLKRFRVDTLKIDQSFVRNMLTTAEDSTIVLAVIALAHNLNFKVIAEGVETEQHCRLLQSNQCDEIQGYYFSPPVTAEEFEAMLREGKKLAVDAKRHV